MKYLNKIIFIIIFLLLICTSSCFANSREVYPTKSNIFLDGKQLYFETYTIDGYNYFKLRDLAYIFNNTNKSFQVEWNNELNRVDISLNTKYTVLGTEMLDLNPYKECKYAKLTSSSIFINGIKKDLIVYKIDGYNYFKLRDLLKIIDCGVGYDNKTLEINIYTTKSYDYEVVKLPILMYHHFDAVADGTNDMIITPQKFENDILTILNKGYTPILFSDLLNYMENGTKLPNKPIIITMDDGYLSNYEYAFKIMKQYNVKACIFPVVRYCEEILWGYPHFDFVQAREMVNSGLVEIQPHTYDMHTETMDTESFYHDTIKAIDKLKSNLNTNVYAFAFPYGLYSDEKQNVLNETGIKISLTTEGGINSIYRQDYSSLKRMKRYLVSQYTNMSVLLDNI